MAQEKEPNCRFLIEPLVLLLHGIAKAGYNTNQIVMPLRNRLWYWMKGIERKRRVM